MQCAICLENMPKNTPKTECGHCFHINCIRKWANNSHMTCPLCRKYIRIYPNTRSQKYKSNIINRITDLLRKNQSLHLEDRIKNCDTIFCLIWKHRIIFRIDPIFINIVTIKINYIKMQIEELECLSSTVKKAINTLNKTLNNLDRL